VSNGGRERSSIFGGLLLILLGVLFFLHHFEPGLGIGHLLHVYWPVLLILWGIAKLFDYLGAQRAGQGHPPLLSGGEAALLIIVILVLVTFGLLDWAHKKNPDLDVNVDFFSQRYSQVQEIPLKVVPPGSHLTVTTGRGNITVHPGDGNELRVTVNESATGSSEFSARARMKNVTVVIDQTSDGFGIHPDNQAESNDRIEVDLDIRVPKNVSLTANATRGDISISGVAGATTAGTQKGDIEIHDAGSDVAADLQNGDARISDVAGNVRITGRGNEVDVSDVGGDSSLEGDFYGPIRVRNVAKTTRYSSPKSDLMLVHLTGRLTIDSGQIEISDVAGAVKLVTHNKDMDIENVSGRLEIDDTHGDIQVRYAQPPREAVSITNESGGVDLTLPSKSSFELSALSRSGEIQSDFEDPSLKAAMDEETGRLNGKYGARGPKITIVTSYGTIYLHKAA
jgi:DUF4097 and DUF4098 domain-containing protein YvlB